MSQIKYRSKKKKLCQSSDPGSKLDLVSDKIKSNKLEKLSSQGKAVSEFEELSCKALPQNLKPQQKLLNNQFLKCSASSTPLIFNQPVKKFPGQLWKDKRFLLFSAVVFFMIFTLISVILTITVFEVEKPFTQRTMVSHTLIRHITVENTADPYDFNQSYWDRIKGNCGMSGFDSRLTGRIAGGNEAEFNFWPWEVAIVRYIDECYH